LSTSHKLHKLVFKYAHLIQHLITTQWRARRKAMWRLPYNAQTLNPHFHFQNILSLCQSDALASFPGSHPALCCLQLKGRQNLVHVQCSKQKKKSWAVKSSFSHSKQHKSIKELLWRGFLKICFSIYTMYRQ